MIGIEDIKIYAANVGAFSVSCFDWLEPTLKVLLLGATLGYTIHRWWLLKKGKDEKNEIMEDVETCIAENGLWPDRASINPEEQAKRFDESLELAQCLREKGLDVPDPTQEDPKLNLSEVDKNRETIKEYLEECDLESKAFKEGK